MKKYDTIYADPPWKYQDRNCGGGAEKHYSTMEIKDICNLPVRQISSDNCILFITYKKSGKFFFGLGRWTRGNTEPCLIATKGKPKRINNSISQLIIAPIEKHSKKPDIVREKIVQLMGDLPRIELFAREKIPGWDVWGNEVESDIIM